MRSDCRPLVQILLLFVLVSAVATVTGGPPLRVLDWLQAVTLQMVDDQILRCEAQTCHRLALLRTAIDARSCEPTVPVIVLSASLMVARH